MTLLLILGIFAYILIGMFLALVAEGMNSPYGIKGHEAIGTIFLWPLLIVALMLITLVVAVLEDRHPDRQSRSDKQSYRPSKNKKRQKGEW